MVKKGPCLHCGINSTPLWRNGPAEKPILCNACGSRYKQKGYLDNYLPKNVQRYSHPRLCNNSDDSTANGTASDLSVDDRVSDHEDSQTGEVNDDLLKSKIPSKKRSLVVYERGTAMERFQKQLLSLYRQSPPAPEDVLLKDNVNNFIPENEIGLGGIFLRPPPADDDTTPTDEGSSSSICPPKKLTKSMQ